MKLSNKTKAAIGAGILAAGFGVLQLTTRKTPVPSPEPGPRINEQLSVNQPPPTLLLITSLAPIQGTLGVPFSRQMTAVNCSDPCKWAGDSMPPGLSISVGGLISGTPSQRGAFAAHVVVTSAPTPWGDGSSRTYSDKEQAWPRINVQ